VAPGVYDAFTALVASQAGFETLYVSGAAIAYTRLGRPDIGLVSMSEVADTIALIRDRVGANLVVDADTGYGNAINVVRTMRSFERAGASAIQLEDQDFPKRCGHLDGKGLIPADEMVGKIKAALDARPSSDVLVVARTDAIGPEGLTAALDRAEAYRDAGADVLFIEALRSENEIAAAMQRFRDRIPLLANMVEGGKTPMKTAAELQALGFSIAIFPGGTVRFLAKGLQDYYASLARNGTTAPMRERMLDFDGLNALIGTPEMLALGKKYEGQ
jgi:2-methylisocitrate lyase-like PEP mutase family enzyme